MAQQIDVVQQYKKLQAALQRERIDLQNRLQQIDAALADSGSPLPVLLSQPRRGRPPGGTKSGMNMREAITQVTAQQPLKVREIAKAMKQLGYKFTSKKPANSVGAFLYGPGGKEHFKKVDGRFSPVGGAMAKDTSSNTSAAAQPVKVKRKRKMTEEGRKNIAAAVQRRWAKVRAEKK